MTCNPNKPPFDLFSFEGVVLKTSFLYAYYLIFGHQDQIFLSNKTYVPVYVIRLLVCMKRTHDATSQFYASHSYTFTKYLCSVQFVSLFSENESYYISILCFTFITQDGILKTENKPAKAMTT